MGLRRISLVPAPEIAAKGNLVEWAAYHIAEKKGFPDFHSSLRDKIGEMVPPNIMNSTYRGTTGLDH